MWLAFKIFGFDVLTVVNNNITDFWVVVHVVWYLTTEVWYQMT
jgi:hypothetical protein